MARTSTLSAAAKPTGVNRKAKQKAAREKKRQRTSSGGSSRRQSRQAPAEEDEGEEEAGDGTTQDIEDMEEEHGHTRPNRRPFVYLKARERKIPQDKITSEWKSLADPSLEKVRGLLTAAKRSVASGARSKKAALMADQAVEALMGQLLMRLPRMPFPPKTNEKAFDLEKSLEQNRALENEMTATIHSIELLKAEIEKQNELLYSDQKRLGDLEKDAKQEVQFWESQAKKKHPLLDLINIKQDIDDGPDDIGLLTDTKEVSIFEAEDDDLQPVLEQFRNHMESIRANHGQVESIPEAIREAGIWVDSF